MAEALENRKELEAVPPIPVRRGSGYKGRFVLAYVLMIGVFAGMIGLFALLVSRSDSASHWSAYHPKGRDAFDKAQNLANYVAPRYLHEGSPLAVVEAQPLIVDNTAVDGIAFSRRPTLGIGGGYKQFEPADATVMYVFCAPSNNCGLSAAAASEAGQLLRRESLELALYTFKYSRGVDSVVAMLPPLKGTQPAVYFKRGALKRVLSKPLNQTLPTRALVTPESMTDAERSTVDRLTANSLYASDFQRLPNGGALLVLAAGNR